MKGPWGRQQLQGLSFILTSGESGASQYAYVRNNRLLRVEKDGVQ
jgi:hypothetical protein